MLTCCSEEKFNSFSDGEKVAACSGIGDGERQAGRDLAGEDFGDASAGGKNIAEAEGGSSR